MAVTSAGDGAPPLHLRVGQEQSAVIGCHRGLLERRQREGRARVRDVPEAHLAEAYAWSQNQVLGRRTGPLREPPEACPWTLDQLPDERWWPPEAPARLP